MNKVTALLLVGFLSCMLPLFAESVNAPASYGPVPSANQLAWHEMEYYGLVCYGLNTYTGQEWGYGDVSTDVFKPTDLNTDQWARVAKAAGMKGLILVAKHHDGFCLWPSKTTEYTIAATSWKNGNGDVLGDLSTSCKKYGLKLGVYVSPWDRNHAEYGREQYIKDYHEQWREVLTHYGDVFEVWFDGANGGSGYYGGARDSRSIPKNYYQYDQVFKLVKELQPQVIFFGGINVDAARWVGNESGYADQTNWSTFSDTDTSNGKQRATGVKGGEFWMPAEADTTILHPKKWYYNENSKPRTLEQFTDLYYTTIGRNASFNLGLSIGPSGRIPAVDVEAMLAQKKQLDRELAVDLAKGVTITASEFRGNESLYHADKCIDDATKTYWATSDGVSQASLTIDFGKDTRFNRLLLQEYIALGQRIDSFTLEVEEHGNWKEVAQGTTIGYKRLLRFAPVEARKVRLTFSTDAPCLTLANLGLFCAPQILSPPAITRGLDGNVKIDTKPGLIAYYAVGPASAPLKFIQYSKPFALPRGGQVHAYATDINTTGKTDTISLEFGVSRVNWKLHSVDSENRQFTPAIHAFDGKPATIWATEWKGSEPDHPHHLAIDLGETLTLTGFSYLTRQDGNKDGLINRYEFHVSINAKQWTRIAHGEFSNIENNPVQQLIRFTKPAAARYIKLVSKSAVKKKPFAVVAELDVFTN